jgi:hypothetical protein
VRLDAAGVGRPSLPERRGALRVRTAKAPRRSVRYASRRSSPCRFQPIDQPGQTAPAEDDPLGHVYCANLPCQNSTIAAERLVELGYTDVREYAEGKQDWIEAGYPIERGVAAVAA